MTKKELQKELNDVFQLIGGHGTLLHCSLGYAFSEIIREIVNGWIWSIKGEIEKLRSELKTPIEVKVIAGDPEEQKRILDDIQWRIVMLEEAGKEKLLSELDYLFKTGKKVAVRELLGFPGSAKKSKKK